MIYYIYKLDFYGTDKIYIGCTTDIGRRFTQHKSSELWLDECVMPKSIEVLKEVDIVFDAWATELKYITASWEDNLNKRKVGYGDWIAQNRQKLEQEEFVKYQKEIDEIEKQIFGKVINKNLAK